MTYKPKYQFIAVISGILTILAFSHLVYGVHITKEAKHLSFTWLCLVLTAQLLLVLYGLINGAYGIYLPAIIIIMGLSYILYIKLYYTKN